MQPRRPKFGAVNTVNNQNNNRWTWLLAEITAPYRCRSVSWGHHDTRWWVCGSLASTRGGITAIHGKRFYGFDFAQILLQSSHWPSRNS